MIGEVVAIKTTGERVFVLSQTVDRAFKVRRAAIGQNGIVHYEEVFLPSELESIEDNVRRELEEMLLKAKLQQEILRKSRIAEASDALTNSSLN